MRTSWVGLCGVVVGFAFIAHRCGVFGGWDGAQ